MRRPIGAKFCMVVRTRPNFIMLVLSISAVGSSNVKTVADRHRPTA